MTDKATPAGLADKAGKNTVPITPLAAERFNAWLKRQSKATAGWVKANGFAAKPGSVCLLPDAGGAVKEVLAGIDEGDGPWAYAGLPLALPAGSYRLAADLSGAQANDAALGWSLACYSFDRYRAVEAPAARLVWPKGADKTYLRAAVEGTALARDLINTPANDMGPGELAAAAKSLGQRFGAKVRVTEGDGLLKKNYPAIHAVGRASARAPRLIEMRWGQRGPQVAVIGKGVCFDTGGLDLKPAGGMKLMKKDMGGAANALGLAAMIMGCKLDVRLRVLIPAVENSVSGDAMRPLDVLSTRKGLTVEVGNTDAEGRLILCDALDEAVSQAPDFMVDFATLTGAARVALGTDLPALFCNHDATAEGILAAGLDRHDPLWRLPLHQPYRRGLDSAVADLNNISDGPYGGAITAALFMEAFTDPEIPWAHIDLMAWNPRPRPGRPAGGEAMGMRAVFGYISALAGKKVGRPRT